jgi:hypothetical protein
MLLISFNVAASAMSCRKFKQPEAPRYRSQSRELARALHCICHAPGVLPSPNASSRCGEGLGVGVAVGGRISCTNNDPSSQNKLRPGRASSRRVGEGAHRRRRGRADRILGGSGPSPLQRRRQTAADDFSNVISVARTATEPTRADRLIGMPVHIRE